VRLQEGSKDAVASMGISKELVLRSVTETGSAGESLKQITDSMVSITDMNTQVASAAEEQTSVAEEINRNIVIINENSDQAAVAGEQTSTSSQELAKLAVDLRNVVGQFKL